MMQVDRSRTVPALKIYQWLPEWANVSFDASTHRRKPKEFFHLLALPADILKTLAGIHRRSTSSGTPRSQDMGIQRRHEPSRSEEIRRFIQFGYPWSELSEAKRKSGEYTDLRKPGWLPSAIIVNILGPKDERNGATVQKDDMVHLEDRADGTSVLHLPRGFSGSSWKPRGPYPIEVIDGQHRLWAFEQDAPASHFDLPVVAFSELDISWQAYQFWTVNIKPKKINPSLAFDLYPLLRTEDWLDKFEGHSVYREARAQELTEHLWGYPHSAWFQRINMLGEPGSGRSMVTQAAWIRSLLATYVRAFEGGRIRIGGLFGAPTGSHRQVLAWTRAQQAAFLIYMGQQMLKAVTASKHAWAQALRVGSTSDLFDAKDDPAFYGRNSLLTTDQGIRGLLFVTNDLCFVANDSLNLQDWTSDETTSPPDNEAITRVLRSLDKQPVAKLLAEIARALASYDWRSSSAPGLADEQRLIRKAFRGSGGYAELRKQLLLHLSERTGEVGQLAAIVAKELRYS